METSVVFPTGFKLNESIGQRAAPPTPCGPVWIVLNEIRIGALGVFLAYGHPGLVPGTAIALHELPGNCFGSSPGIRRIDLQNTHAGSITLKTRSQK